MSRIYLDYASATPLDRRVFSAMKPYLAQEWGNSSSLHQEGVRAKIALENARKTVADCLFARPEEIVFTAGATESLNLAILGQDLGLSAKRVGLRNKPHFITTAIEHEVVLECMKEVKRRGAEVTVLSVDEDGLLDPKKLARAFRHHTRLVSVQYASNEIGTVQNLVAIARVIREANYGRPASSRILFHTDASSAAGFLNLNVNKLGVDLLTLNGAKIYGPKQAGILYVRKGVKLSPVIFGGGQERGLRGGTESVANAVGFAKALELTQHVTRSTYQKTEKLRDALWQGIRKIYPKVILNGSPCVALAKQGTAHQLRAPNRLPNNLNVSFMGLDGEALMFYLDAQGVAVSTGSACSAKQGPSHVILAISKNSVKRASSSIRFTLGQGTTLAQIKQVLKVLPEAVDLVRHSKNI